MPLPSHVIDNSLLTNGVHGDVDKGLLGDGGGGILWLPETGDHWNNEDNTVLGSDESLGGALLTPIPWLRNGASGGSGSEESGDFESGETDDLLGSPIELLSSTTAITNGHSTIPEREDGAVMQGELRQEQEAGVVSVGHNCSENPDMMIDEDGDSDEEIPHARGPAVVGAVDVGMVNGKGMEVNIGNQSSRGKGLGVERGVRDAQEVLIGGNYGRRLEGQNGGDEDMQIDGEIPETADPQVQSGEGFAAQSSEGAMDEDTIITDADGAAEEEAKVS
jgi:hypothetical protein